MTPIYAVNFSGGLASCEALRRTIEKHGKENTVALFADVKGDPSRDSHAAPAGSGWDGEDDDVYRFIGDVERLFGMTVRRVSHPDGLGVWGVIFKDRAITIQLPSGTTFAPCTKRLKQEAIDAALAEVASGGREVVSVLGLGWSEMHRVEKHLKHRDAGAWFPNMERPFVDNCHITTYLEANGIQPPRSYRQGFPHANCGGACIKAGISQWVRLHEVDRGRYLYNEGQETEFRETINPNVAILTETVKGVQFPLPLSELRRRIEGGNIPLDRFSWGGCGCFAEIPQLRMEEIAAESNGRMSAR